MVCVSSGPDTRSARTKARRRIAASMHSGVSCTHAPLPGSTARSSRTRTESMATTLRRAEREARVRHPTHVRTGIILHPDSESKPTAGRPGSGVLEDRIGLDVDLGARELGGEARVLPLLADRERQLVVGDERADCLAGGIQ